MCDVKGYKNHKYKKEIYIKGLKIDRIFNSPYAYLGSLTSDQVNTVWLSLFVEKFFCIYKGDEKKLRGHKTGSACFGGPKSGPKFLTTQKDVRDFHIPKNEAIQNAIDGHSKFDTFFGWLVKIGCYTL